MWRRGRGREEEERGRRETEERGEERQKKGLPGGAAAGKDVVLVSLVSSRGTLLGPGQRQTHTLHTVNVQEN